MTRSDLLTEPADEYPLEILHWAGVDWCDSIHFARKPTSDSLHFVRRSGVLWERSERRLRNARPSRTREEKIHMRPEKSHAKPIYPPRVAGIFVRKLFGRYSYDLAPNPDAAGDSDRVLLLYGDNGTGKTTVAQLLFHLLSRRTVAGHRTFLAQTRFASFAVSFTNGVRFSAERSEGQLIGPYVLKLERDGHTIAAAQIETRDDFSVNPELHVAALENLFAHVSTPPLSAYLLSDNRVLQSDELVPAMDEDDLGADVERSWDIEAVARRRAAHASRTRVVHIEPSIKRAEAWMQRRALSASKVGQANMSTIYNDIIRRIARSPDPAAPSQTDMRAIAATLGELRRRSEELAQFGLATPSMVEELSITLELVGQKQAALIAAVVEPYISSVRARLDAAADLYKKLHEFLRIVNGFYRRKRVEVDVSDGIRVISDDQSLLNPELLSSGEKQLMLLLCSILAASDKPTLFIIDEPELSLNVKWQRELIQSFLTLVEGESVQFLMATHSIELITPYEQCVMQLIDLERERTDERTAEAHS